MGLLFSILETNSNTRPLSLLQKRLTKMLLVSIPLNYALNDQRTFAFYFSLIEASSRCVDIGILQGVDGGRLTGRFLKHLKDKGLSDESLARIHFIPSLSSDYWIRDFGPLFAIGKKGNLAVTDAIYRNLEHEKEVWDTTPMDIDSNHLVTDFEGFEAFRLSKRRNEVTPNYVDKFLRQTFQCDCDLVRPPLHLQGGDYIQLFRCTGTLHVECASGRRS